MSLAEPMANISPMTRAQQLSLTSLCKRGIRARGCHTHQSRCLHNDETYQVIKHVEVLRVVLESRKDIHSTRFTFFDLLFSSLGKTFVSK